MKNVFKKMSLLCCVVALMAGFSACSSEEDNGPYVVTYYAEEAALTGGDDPWAGVKIISEYNEVIKQVMGGSYCTTDKDAEIIEACDNVFETHKTKYPAVKGSVSIEKIVGTTTSADEELSGQIIKTYKYE